MRKLRGYRRAAMGSTALVMLVALGGPLAAQNVPERLLSDNELYRNAERAAASNDYVEAMVSIYAYLQKNTDYLLKDTTKRGDVWDFYRNAAMQVDRALHSPPGSKYTYVAPPHLPVRADAPATKATVRVEAPPTMPPVSAEATGVFTKPLLAAVADPLVCRGGGNMHFTYTPYSRISREPQIWIRFGRGTAPAGMNRENVANLAPGQCTRLDRPIAPSEADMLVLTAPVFTVQQFSISWQRGQVAGISQELSQLQRDDVVRTFRAYNDGADFLIVTAIE